MLAGSLPHPYRILAAAWPYRGKSQKRPPYWRYRYRPNGSQCTLVHKTRQLAGRQ